MRLGSSIVLLVHALGGSFFKRFSHVSAVLICFRHCQSRSPCLLLALIVLQDCLILVLASLVLHRQLLQGCFVVLSSWNTSTTAMRLILRTVVALGLAAQALGQAAPVTNLFQVRFPSSATFANPADTCSG
jgi:hypothetical protein